MNGAGPTFAQIRSQVEAIRRQRSHTRAIAIRSAASWHGERDWQEGEDAYAIYQCDSPLAMRLALREATGDAIKVIVSNLEENQLSDDIRVRLDPPRFMRLDAWQTVRALFEATSIDPRLGRHLWIAELLMERRPTGGYSPAAGGFLDYDTVWSILLNAELGLTVDRPDLVDLLQWSTATKKDLQRLSEDFREAASNWICARSGEATGLVFRCMVDHGPRLAVPIGLVAGVLYAELERDRRQKQIGKFEERFLSGASVPAETMLRWQASAADALSRSFDDQLRRTVLAQTDKLLADLGAQEWAFLSDASPLGFDQRMQRFGETLMNITESARITSSQELEKQARYIFDHRKGESETRRLERLQMAVRLVRWLASDQPDSPASLREAAQQYLAEGGYIDWARWMLRAGDPVSELGAAYGRLFDRVTARCIETSQRFAELLRDWTSAKNSDEVLVPVEQILEQVVAPVAANTPVLVIVIDGMSVAVFRELVQSIVGTEWWLLGEEGAGLRPALAAVPSVTELSRTSLLTGRLQRGDSATEKKGFAQHPALLSTSRNGFPPLLYHKASLVGNENAGLAGDIRDAIDNIQQQQVVGVVINAVDDNLAKGEQLDTAWTRDTIKVLPLLLHAAKTARRTVVLLSDHGHVLEAESKKVEGDGNERWRAADGSCQADEVRIEGERVLGEGDAKALIAPSTEKIRYAMKKNGYHGGLTPQEMVVPIGVLGLPNAELSGWEPLPPAEPRWWDQPSWSDPESEQEPVEEQQPPPGMLFDKKPATPPAATTAAEPAWVAQLLSSPLFAEQKKLAGRKVPPDDVFRKVLAAIDRQGGKVTAVALARAIQYPEMRLAGLLTLTARVLNVDGFQVLAREDASDTIALDTGLLCKQFELES